MTPEKFHTQYYGWGKDVDGVAGVQCVDLFKEFLRIIGVSNYTSPIGGDGYADNIWYNRTRWQKWFDFITNGQFQDGDIVIFPHKKRGGTTHPLSHVCFYYGGKQFGTNQHDSKLGRKACDKACNWSDALGALRYKNWEAEASMKNGLNTYTYSGQRIYVVHGYGDYKQLRMLTANGYKQLEDITALDGGSIVRQLAVANCNYFQLKTGQADEYGQHYGVEQGDMEYSQAPKQAQWLVFYQLNDGTCGYTTSDQYWYSTADVIFACSPYSVRIHDGKEINVRSSACGNKDTTKTQQTAYFLGADGAWNIAVCAGKLTPGQMLIFLKSLGSIKELFFADSGGSSQLTYIGKKKVYTGRKLPDVLALGYLLNESSDSGSTDSGTTDDYKAKYEALKNEFDSMSGEMANLKAGYDLLNSKLEKVKEIVE